MHVNHHSVARKCVTLL